MIGWDLVVPEIDVRNVISRMLLHERLDILLDAPGVPLRSVRYDSRGFGEALDSIDDPCGWKQDITTVPTRRLVPSRHHLPQEGGTL